MPDCPECGSYSIAEGKKCYACRVKTGEHEVELGGEDIQKQREPIGSRRYREIVRRARRAVNSEEERSG